MALVLTIGGVVKEFRAGSLNISATANGRTTAKFTVLSVDGSYRPPFDAEVIITENGTRIFGGLVDRPTEKGLIEGSRPAIATEISAYDFNQYAERRFVLEGGGFPAGYTLKQCLVSLVGYLEPFGVTLSLPDFDGSQVQFFIQQAELYRYAAEGDARLLTFFNGDTLTDYNAKMAALKSDFETIIAAMPGDEEAALYAGHATALGWRPAQGFTGSLARFFVQQAEFYRYVDGDDPRINTFFYAGTLTDYDTEIGTRDAALDAVISGMALDEAAAFSAAKIVAEDDYGFTGTSRQFLVQQVEFYRWMPEGDPRILTFFYAPTLAAYEAVMGGVNEDDFADIVSAMAVDELAAITTAYATAQLAGAAHDFTGTVVQFFVQQAEYYRWLPEGDLRLLTFFGAPTLSAYDTLMSGANEDDFADIIAAMAVDEAAAFTSGYAGAALQGQPTGPTFPEIICEFKQVSEIFNDLATLTGKYGDPYVWRIDHYKNLSMVQPSDTAAPFDITTANGRAEGDVTVEVTREKYANRVILKVPPKQEVNRVETFTGDGSTDTFQLQYTPTATRGYVGNGAANETLTSTDFAGTATWELNTATNEITRVAGAPALGEVVTMTFDGSYTATATAEDAGEIATYGPWEKVITVESVPSDTTAQALVDGELAKCLPTPKTIKYRTRGTGLVPGQTQTIMVARRNLSVSALITDVVTRDAGNGNVLFRDVTAVVGSTHQGGWRDVIKVWSGDKLGKAAPITSTPSIGAGVVVSGAAAPPHRAVQFNRNGSFAADAAYIYYEDENSIVCGGGGSSITAAAFESCQVFGYDNHIADP